MKSVLIADRHVNHLGPFGFTTDIEEPFDLLIDWRGGWHVMEVKNPETNARKKGGSKLTDTQEQILLRLSATVHVVETAKEAVDAMAAVPK